MATKEKFVRAKQFISKHSVNFIIIIVSTLLFLILLDLSTGYDGVAHEVLVNLSASMLAIGITVILVDILRERRLESQFKTPRAAAIKKILGSHSVLALNLALKNRGKYGVILSELMQFVNKRKDDQFVLANGAKEAFEKLADIPADEIVSNYDDEELTGALLKALKNIRKNYTDTGDKYMFSFSGAVMRSDYALLLENLDSVITAAELIEVSGKELEKLFKPIDDTKSSKPLTTNGFVGAVLVGYIKSLNNFMSKYLN